MNAVTINGQVYSSMTCYDSDLDFLIFKDIDECLTQNICADEQCINAPGSYQCVPCTDGFRGWNGQCHGMFYNVCIPNIVTFVF